MALACFPRSAQQGDQMFQAPTIKQIKAAASDLKGRAVRTPTLRLSDGRLKPVLPEGAEVSIKLELFQNAGSFKSRGVLLGFDRMTPAERKSGVVAASAGNHALAVSWAANLEGVAAHICMPSYADPMRIEGCKALGAKISLFDDVAGLFDGMEEIARNEGRKILHPYEAEHMTLGAATCGAEFVADCPDMDIVAIPVGGGGFISGMSRAIKQLSPNTKIYGVEPFGADSMFRSFAAGGPVKLDKVDTIADSLAAPMTLPISCAITRANTEAIVRVTDDEIIAAMGLIYDGLKIAAEPACAATLAAILGPLRDEVAGKKVGIVACGSNISLKRFSELLARG